ncbi:MAG: hypothetical protein J6V44_07620 [Methanobrevibacter sp.]|nr:hypothetical protein [Methanobrevibacter sp.]
MIGRTVLKFWNQPILHSGNYTTYTVKKDGTGATGTWGISISGDAATATKLKTARTINGTSFDGSSNITTANWGTARTVSISSTAGTTGTSVNGSANVSLVIPKTMTGFTSITSTTFVGALNGNATTASALTDLASTDAASSTSTKRYVWFSYDNNKTGRPAYNANFTY